MTKRKNQSSRYDQPGLFDFVIAQIKAAISENIRHAVDDHGKEISRAIVAAKMTDLIGKEITDMMFDNPTATGRSREMPTLFLTVFLKSAGGRRRTAGVISRHSGLFLMPGPEVLRVEIQRYAETVKDAMREKRRRLFYLREQEEK